MNAIHRRHKARQDLVDIFRYYAREAGLRVAQRFFAQVEATLTRLAGMPGMGTHYNLDHPALADLRFFPVSRFRMYLVFYRTCPRRHRGSACPPRRGATSPASWQRNLAWMRLPTRNRKKSQTSPDRKSPDPAAAHHRHRPYV